MISYADTGFLFSLYGRDANSAAAIELAKSQPTFLVTPLIETEFANAVELRLFRNEWMEGQARMVQDLFDQHQKTGLLQAASLSDAIWEEAVSLSRRYSRSFGTRTLDVLHVATALILKAEVFFTFDKRQHKLAMAIHVRVLPA